MKKNLYVFEVFNEFERNATDDERINYLRANGRPVIKEILKLTFDPNIEFSIKEVPEYRKDDSPVGLSMSHLDAENKMLYIFRKSEGDKINSRNPNKLKQLVTQMLERVHFEEAKIIEKMIKRDLEIPFLTQDLVARAFPGLVPEFVPTEADVEKEILRRNLAKEKTKLAKAEKARKKLEKLVGASTNENAKE